MSDKLIIIVLAGVLIYSGKCLVDLRTELNSLSQEFQDYKSQVNEKFDSIRKLDNNRRVVMGEYGNYQRKAIKDIQRENVVIEKPGLVEKKINDSFKELMASIGGGK